MSNQNEAEEKTCEELKALSAAWEQAIVANNAEAIGHFMADDWVIVSETGITKRADFLAVVASGDLTHEAFHGDVISVRQYGDTAIAIGRVRNNGTYKGQPFSADEWTTDVFLKSGGQWRCVYSHITAVKEARPL